MKESQMYANDWCTRHTRATRIVGRPGTDEERQQCDKCEAEFQRSLARLVAA